MLLRLLSDANVCDSQIHDVQAILLTSVDKLRRRNLKDAEDPVLTPPPAL